jgi:hypothetical protein
MKRTLLILWVIALIPAAGVAQEPSKESVKDLKKEQISTENIKIISDQPDALVEISESVTGIYKFTNTLDQSVSPQKELNGKSVSFKKGYLVDVLYKKDGLVYYKFLKFKNDTLLKAKFNGSDNEKVFAMPEQEFLYLTQKRYKQFKGFNVGAYTIPFRLRDIGGGAFDFEQSLSLSTNLIAGWGSRNKPDSWFDASLGIGITGVTLNAKNTNNTIIKNRTATAFTLSTGAVFKPLSYVNFGVFGGWDFLGNQDRDEVNWIYNGKFWLGLGINISFNVLKTQQTTDKGGKYQTN